MKLLFDQNISFRVLRRLSGGFGECRHVKTEGLNNRDDIDIWQYAKANGFAIVTFDADFFDMSLIRGIPPKIIWLRTGNLTTAEIAERIIFNSVKITSFLNDVEQNCLEIF